VFCDFQNEPVFYNSAGQLISREEAGFSGDDSDFIGMSREEQEAYLQWEAENMVCHTNNLPTEHLKWRLMLQ